MLTTREYAKNLGRVIQRKREAVNMGLADLGEEFGLTKEEVAGFEDGSKFLSFSQLIQMARLFDTRPGLLLLEAEMPDDPQVGQASDILGSISGLFADGIGAVKRIADLVQKDKKSKDGSPS